MEAVTGGRVGERTGQSAARGWCLRHAHRVHPGVK